MLDVVIVAHNIRSTHNIGSIFRTCDGFGVKEIILSGYSPYPSQPGDERLPYIRDKITKQIHKTALGAESNVPFRYIPELNIAELKNKGYMIVGLEQSPASHKLPYFDTPAKFALILGEEVDGLSREIIEACDELIEIPMKGLKESFNVSVAAGIALYHLTLVGVQ